jgi:hypothetical protein
MSIKAATSWSSYKDILGIAESPPMAYNLDNLVNSHILAQLDEPFSPEEIDTVYQRNAHRQSSRA